MGFTVREATRGAGRSWIVGVSAMALVAAAMLAGPAPVAAQSRFDSETEFGQGLDAFTADGPMIAVVSIPSQQLRVFDRNGVVASTRVSTGRRGYETPEGVFTIIERKVEHNSNLYDDASMPFMQRITWSGVAFHEGVVPSHRASHGCIRLPVGFAERLYRTTRLGTRVVIVGHDATPLPIEHQALLQPGRVPPAASPASAAAEAPATRAEAPLARDADGNLVAPMMLGARHLPRPEAPAASAAAGAATSGIAEAIARRDAEIRDLRARRVAAEGRLAAATKAIAEARSGVRPRTVENRQSDRSLRQAAALARRAEERVETLDEAVDKARTPAALAVAMDAHIASLIELAVVRGREHAAREAMTQRQAAAAALAEELKRLEAERQQAQNEARALARRLSPVTVFVSRQNGRVYVRQANQPVMDAAVTIRDADRAIGTHVFTALDADATAGGLRWVGITVETPGGGAPVAAPAAPKEAAKRRKGDPAPEPVSLSTARGEDPLRTARAALDRIQLPDDVLARVVPALMPGSTLVISDLGQSIETGPGTDIVVQTKGEEQAKINIANFVARKKAEAAGVAWVDPRSRRRADREAGNRRSSGGSRSGGYYDVWRW